MTTVTTVRGRVVATERLHSSQGNPRHRVVIEEPGGRQTVISTAPRSVIGYAITNPEYQESDHTFTINKHGNIIGVR